MNKKRKWIKAGILVLVFILAVIISSLIMSRGTDDQTVSLGEPTLPRVSFTVEGQTVNTLAGYTDEMDVTAMRDTITPIGADGSLQMNVEADGQEITGIQYEVLSLDGEESYVKENVEDSGKTVKLQVGGAFQGEVRETVLKVTLRLGSQSAAYYTRIEPQKELSIKECLNFAKNFQGKTFSKGSKDAIENYLEPNEQSDNTTLQTVNIHSNAYHIQWGEMTPEISTDVEWSIKESNSVYTSLLARYRVTDEGDGGEVETYNIREFFRVRCSQGEMYLLDYSRSMNQVFNGNKKVIDKEGIVLGLADADISYETNKKGTVLSFVAERDLWTYNRKADELSLVFSFANMEGQDARSRNDEHEVRIISVDDAGTTFAVYGYMNRGEHEGQVGVDVYYFDIGKNAVEELAFIPSTKSFAIAEDELGKMVYCNQELQQLYVLAGGTLYQVDLKRNKQEKLAENLEEGQYVVSGDGHLLAYQTDGTIHTATKVQVLNLKSGESFEVNARENEAIRPLGFVTDDFICGYIREEDKGVTVSGESVRPMYELEIRDMSDKVLKTYAEDGVYMTDVLVEENLVTVNRVTKAGDVYTGAAQDYITNNEEYKEREITLERFSTELKETQMRFTFAKGIKDTSPRLLRPKQVMRKDAVTISFDSKTKKDKYYVYGMGELNAVYDKAAYAIQKAEQVSGVVISSEQSYIWEKGNRDLVYYTEAEPFGKAEGQTSLEACDAFMERYEAKRVNLTGCTLNQVLYIINKGRPVIAMPEANHAVLLTGYSTENVTYIDPEDGAEHTVGVDEMNAMLAAGGNTFIGYVK